ILLYSITHLYTLFLHDALPILALAGVIAAWSIPAAAQQVIRVGWLIPAEEAKYWMMKRPAEFPQIGSKYKIEWVQFQGTSPVMRSEEHTSELQSRENLVCRLLL